MLSTQNGIRNGKRAWQHHPAAASPGSAGSWLTYEDRSAEDETSHHGAVLTAGREVNPAVRALSAKPPDEVEFEAR
jgi:hypothetical protein